MPPHWYDDDDLDDDDLDGNLTITTRIIFPPPPIPAEQPPLIARLALERWNAQARTFYRETPP